MYKCYQKPATKKPKPAVGEHPKTRGRGCCVLLVTEGRGRVLGLRGARLLALALSLCAANGSMVSRELGFAYVGQADRAGPTAATRLLK